ncbi:hypothetical protein CPB84DRAFT_1784667 [Gymnopilus junonius]|uniref:Acyltransferase 3 domain-containing protein n=1 Tax=Gymnopilus junonius TaxID=109634 RepID=A0A9P5TL14_GYMJU|nr:hypothetical protein CPB84DRAFT_1784667 [Gymnopilus junonius]
MAIETTPPRPYTSSRVKTPRVHWLDNLRTFLIILLIFHHAALEVVQTSLDGGYFLVVPESGDREREGLQGVHVPASQDRRSSTCVDLVWRNLFIRFLQKIGLGEVFDLHDHYKATTRMVGPVGFHYSHLDISRLFRKMVSSRRGFILTACLGVRFYIGHYYRTFVFDIREYPNSPAAFVIAYIAGVGFPSIKQYLLFDLRKSIIAMVHSELFAYVSLGIAQDLMPALGRSIQLRDRFSSIVFFTDPGLNMHTIFYVLWTTFVFHAFVRQASFTKKDWGLWTKHTYPQTYIHILSIVLVLHFLPHSGPLSDVVLQVVIPGTVAILISWAVVLLPILATRSISSRR